MDVCDAWHLYLKRNYVQMHMAKCQLSKNILQIWDANEGAKEFWVMSFKSTKCNMSDPCNCLVQFFTDPKSNLATLGLASN